MTGPIDFARISAVLALFAGIVVLRALHDLTPADFDRFATLLIGAVIGALSQGVRPGRKTDPPGGTET